MPKFHTFKTSLCLVFSLITFGFEPVFANSFQEKENSFSGDIAKKSSKESSGSSFQKLDNQSDKQDITKENDEEEFLEAEKLFVSQPKIADPYEAVNRKIFAFNEIIDRILLEPVAKSYRAILPKAVRKSVANFSKNLTMPISALNSFAQGKVDNGLANLSSFLINSTIGVFGLFEIAESKGIISKKEDFGQTLGRYKIGPGSFLMLPILGPSSSRDLGGTIFDKSVDIFSFNFLEIGGSEDLIDDRYRIAMAASSGISTREGLIKIIDSVRKDSLDPYSTIRSAYLQRRANEVKN